MIPQWQEVMDNIQYAFFKDHSYWIKKSGNSYIFTRWRVFPEPSFSPIVEKNCETLAEAKGLLNVYA
jgi:hypothetical protein